MFFRTAPSIILRRRDVREYDRALTFFSETEGKFDAIARGVRKIESKLAGSLEPLTAVHLTVVPGRTWPTVTGSEVQNNFPRFRSDLPTLAAASVLVDLVDHFTRPRAIDRRLFVLLKEALGLLDGAAGTAEVDSIRVAATWQIFKILGFGPAIDRCVSCHRLMKSDEPAFFSSSLGGSLGDECRQRDVHASPFDPAERALLQAATAESLADFAKRRVSPNVMDRLIESWIEAHGTSQLASIRFIKSVRTT